MNETDLKPCPFCGGPANVVITRWNNIDGQIDETSRIDCQVHNMLISPKEWNTRAIEDAQAAEISSLTSDVERLKVEANVREMTAAQDVISSYSAKMDEMAAKLAAAQVDNLQLLEALKDVAYVYSNGTVEEYEREINEVERIISKYDARADLEAKL